MGGSEIYDEWKFTSHSNRVLNIVLVGRTGNGKSATGNSILGRKAFKSDCRSSGVTSTCQLHQTVLGNGQIINVIDTPGLFDISDESEFVSKEIVKCIEMSKEGILAVLLVLSVRTRFSREEGAALRTLQELSGSKIIDYMIVVFSGGDALKRNQKLTDYLGPRCPEILSLCRNRIVLFDNITENEVQRAAQKEAKNSCDQQEDLKVNSKLEISELMEQMQKAYDEPLKRITEEVESRLREATERLEQQLAEEKASREKLEERNNCVIL